MLQTSLGWSSCALGHVGKVRKVNEDAYLDKPDIGLWAIADGMGGHAAGDEASQLIVANLDQINPQASLRDFMAEVEGALQGAHRALVTARKHLNNICGSTVVALLAQGNRCAYLWAGDSRAYLFRGGRLTQLTTDHSQAELYVQMGLMTPEEARGHPAANQVTRAIGAGNILRLDIGAVDIESGDRYLLCSDGLSKHITHHELAGSLAVGSTAEVAQGLIDKTLLRGASDNVTVIVIDIHNARLREADMDKTNPHVSLDIPTTSNLP